MAFSIKKDSTDVSIYFHLRDSSDGTSKTGLTFESAGNVSSYVRNRGTRQAINLITLAAADSVYSSGGFKEVDGTNMVGVYRLDLPDAAVATGVDDVVIHIAFTGVFAESLRIDLVDKLVNDLNDISAADVNAQCDTALSDYDGPTNAEMEARTLVAASYFDAGSDTVANVTTTGNLTTNNDKTGYGLANDAITPSKYNDAAAYIPYEGGIWVDSGASNTNTVVGVDGLSSNPVSTLTAARTLADAIGVKKYYIINASSLTLAAAHESWVFVGIDRASILSLGGQDVDNSVFYNLLMTGTQGGTGIIKLYECCLTTLLALRPWATACWIAGDITILTGTMVIFDQCLSGVAGNTTPELTYSAGVTNVNFRHYSGGLKIINMTSDHTMSFETDGQLIIDASCTSGVIAARGNMSITDNGTTMNITKDAVYNKTEALDAIVDDSTQFSGADIASIDAKTTNLPADPASETNVDATETKVDTLTSRLGTPANFDSGGATIADNLKKLADDNGGVSFDAETDSQRAIAAGVGGTPPTVQEIVDGVWDETNADHLDSGSTGKQLNDISVTTSTGDNEFDITVKEDDTNGALLSNTVIVIKDSSGVTTHHREKAGTDATINVALDNGTYQIYLYLSTYTGSNPQTLTVTDDTDQEFFMTAFDPGTPNLPDQCRVFHYHFDSNGDAIVGATWSAIVIDDPSIINAGLLKYESLISTESDSDGLSYIDLVQGINHSVNVNARSYNILIPNTSTATLNEIFI